MRLHVCSQCSLSPEDGVQLKGRYVSGIHVKEHTCITTLKYMFTIECIL